MASSRISDRRGRAGDRGGGAAAHARRAPLQRAMTVPRLMLLPALLALALAGAGCGGDDEGTPIPSATATALNGELDGVQRRLDEGSAGACKDILEARAAPISSECAS